MLLELDISKLNKALTKRGNKSIMDIEFNHVERGSARFSPD